MQKTFSLGMPGREPGWIAANLRSEVGKYINRAKRKPLPDGQDWWEFDCRVGPDPGTAGPVTAKALPYVLDAFVASGAPAVYVEILARPVRLPRAPARPSRPTDGTPAAS